jgi:hypothetical protein
MIKLEHNYSFWDSSRPLFFDACALRQYSEHTHTAYTDIISIIYAVYTYY